MGLWDAGKSPTPRRSPHRKPNRGAVRPHAHVERVREILLLYMGIDITAVWNGQTGDEERAQAESWRSVEHGQVGYLREAYHGEPYATRFLFREAFESEIGEARIPAATLRYRLPETLEVVEARERGVYHEADEFQIESVKESFRKFVALCERKETETGEPVLI